MERYVVALQIFRLDGKYFAWTDLQSVLLTSSLYFS